MSPQRLPRWTALLALPLLAGALLFMHGLAAATTDGPHTTLGAAPTHVHHAETPAEHHDAGCPGCAVSHVMAACVAIVATVVGLRLTRRAIGARRSRRFLPALRGIRAAGHLLRPPDPAWVRLAVMRC